MRHRYFPLIVGIIYVIVGILGFIPGLVAAPTLNSPSLLVNAGYGYLMGLFPINILHNLVHIGVGLWGISSYGSLNKAQSFSRGLVYFYGLLAIMGLIPILNTTFGIIPIFGHDIWLHAITAAIAAYFGFIKPPKNSVKTSDERTQVSRY